MLVTESNREDLCEEILADISTFFAENGFVPSPVNLIERNKPRLKLYGDAKFLIAQWREQNPAAITKVEQMAALVILQTKMVMQLLIFGKRS